MTRQEMDTIDEARAVKPTERVADLTCPECGAACVVPIRTIAWWRAQAPGHRLWCSKCGHAFVGTDAEVAAAEAAWEASRGI